MVEMNLLVYWEIVMFMNCYYHSQHLLDHEVFFFNDLCPWFVISYVLRSKNCANNVFVWFAGWRKWGIGITVDIHFWWRDSSISTTSRYFEIVIVFQTFTESALRPVLICANKFFWINCSHKIFLIQSNSSHLSCPQMTGKIYWYDKVVVTTIDYWDYRYCYPYFVECCFVEYQIAFSSILTLQCCSQVTIYGHCRPLCK